jgi:importin subunit beta-1
VRVREASFECLVKIAATYYDKLPPYMDTIFNLTHRAAKEDEEDVAKQAIEFWCTVCEEEIDIQEVRGCVAAGADAACASGRSGWISNGDWLVSFVLERLRADVRATVEA